MSTFTSCLAFAMTVAAAGPLAAQQAMGHDSAMMGHDAMSHDAMGHGAMGHAFVQKGAAVTGGYTLGMAMGHQTLSLTDDFTLGKSSTPFVVLSTTDMADPSSVWLGEVKSRKGAQTFDIPTGTDLSHFSHVVIWSKSAKAALASADLPHGAMSSGM